MLLHKIESRVYYKEGSVLWFDGGSGGSGSVEYNTLRLMGYCCCVI